MLHSTQGTIPDNQEILLKRQIVFTLARAGKDRPPRRLLLVSTPKETVTIAIVNFQKNYSLSYLSVKLKHVAFNVKSPNKIKYK